MPNQYTGKYSHLLEEVEGDLKSQKEKKVKRALEKRIEFLDVLKEAVKELECEIKQLLKDGKITKLSRYIKIDEGEDEGRSACVSLKSDSLACLAIEMNNEIST